MIIAALVLALPAPPGVAQEENGKDRVLQADPANDRFELALLSYREAGEQEDAERRKATYLAAIKQFDRFHAAFPNHPNAIKSWYYSAVCYQKVGNLKKFRGCLSKVVTTWEQGPLVGAAAYQLAHEHYKAGQYEKAAPLYQLTAREADNAEFRHRALYRRALCFEKLEARVETIAALRAVLLDEGSPFQEQSERVLAHYYKKDGQKEEALAHFINLVNSRDRKTKADATLQCALLARDLGKKEFARRYFEAILVTPGLEEWRGEAQLSLMSEASLAGEHQAYGALEQTEESTALFKELAEIAPDNMTAFEAGYLVLSREYKTGEDNLMPQAEKFLKRFEARHPGDARIHNARLMLAE
ncbi:MAG: hypothetical protein GWO24_19005, partial [Akkermansiaceae bacterium]|nr:hypothetical protein [Akkermansiaceae bacterium]